jgi:polyisoprenoid-binding protein YceI
MSWQIDPSHSQIQFSVRHMMITTVRGHFDKFSGSVDFNEADPSKSTIVVEVDLASINTRDANRDGHLRSPDFFDAEHYPTATFKSTKVEKLDDDHGRITGDLTIRGTTHPVTLDVEYTGMGTMWGRTSAGFNGQTKFNRKDWGLSWNQTLESGGLLVGEVVTINVELELVKQADAQPVAEDVAT